ncbi:MAG: UDP-3-O-acyl-N-acetylglucosamine deacetylase [Candidatus Margulisbacteria bacterium]|nr:UDP-3-O-acyl-N-acetylglucosamine deacetylase [Candidatus Margulisiibacteriota bacterium]
MKQKTIKSPFKLAGIGLHTGEQTSLQVSPAAPNSGIIFIKAGRKIPAKVNQVKETKRGTSLDGIAVTEHLLAAIFALGIDNLEIEIKGGELPAMDGSALPFVEALEKAGIAEQTLNKNHLTVQQPLRLTAGEAALEALPYNGFKVDFMVDFPGIGEQHCSFELENEAFKKRIAPARTFGYIEEYELLKEQGLARGASFDNALVLGKDGYLNPPRFPDELVRHKILDLIGDLALLGQPLKAWIKANKSGHQLNIELVRRLTQK